ncbi:hypothetical protein B0H13DRAFT_2333003 [Mycena leptocephala]|nr:hypothetical protein B0H13DRAFT_2333003 [Mycena leptocephala]
MVSTRLTRQLPFTHWSYVRPPSFVVQVILFVFSDICFTNTPPDAFLPDAGLAFSCTADDDSPLIAPPSLDLLDLALADGTATNLSHWEKSVETPLAIGSVV